jgi:hypothetical protein
MFPPDLLFYVFISNQKKKKKKKGVGDADCDGKTIAGGVILL